MKLSPISSRFLLVPLLLSLGACAESANEDMVYAALEDVADASIAWNIEADFLGASADAQRAPDVDELRASVRTWVGECGRVLPLGPTHFIAAMTGQSGDCSRDGRGWSGNVGITLDGELEDTPSEYKYNITMESNDTPSLATLSGFATVKFLGGERVYESELASESRGRRARIRSERTEHRDANGARRIDGHREFNDCEERRRHARDKDRESGDRDKRDECWHDYTNIDLRRGELLPRGGHIVVSQGEDEFTLTFEDLGDDEVEVRNLLSNDEMLRIRVDPRTAEVLDSERKRERPQGDRERPGEGRP